MIKHLRAVFATLTLVAASSALAVPVATSPGGLAPGLNSRWVAVSPNPHTIGEAMDALAGAGGFTIVDEVNMVASQVDFDDSCCGAGNLDPLASLGYDSYANRYEGYLQIFTPGDYTFAMYHDDGIRVNLGGETIIDFPVDTGPTATFSSTFALGAGYYALEIIGWEQGGLFIQQFYSDLNGNGYYVVGADALHHGVPEPGTLALLGVALAGLGWMRRKVN